MTRVLVAAAIVLFILTSHVVESSGEICLKDTGTDTSFLGGVALSGRESVMDRSQAAGNGLEFIWIGGAILNDGLTLKSDAVLSWNGTYPTRSRLAFQVMVGKLGIVST